jgi:hypothetical protein
MRKLLNVAILALPLTAAAGTGFLIAMTDYPTWTVEAPPHWSKPLKTLNFPKMWG